MMREECMYAGFGHRAQGTKKLGVRGRTMRQCVGCENGERKTCKDDAGEHGDANARENGADDASDTMDAYVREK